MDSSSPTAQSPTDRFQWAIYGISATIYLVVAFLILGPRPEGLAGGVDVSALPTVNASINAVTTVLLLCGLAAIRARRVSLHRGIMISAFGMSTLFLVTYVIYHWFKVGPSHYSGAWPVLYGFILISHILLAAVILPLALMTLIRGLAGDFWRHKRIARPTYVLWLYVSVTGVVIYWMVHT